MNKLLLCLTLFFAGKVFAQDSLFNTQEKTNPQPVKIFSSEKVIVTNTTEPVGRGRMQFLVTHYFDDLAGTNGGIKNFFGLDNSTDIRIGFHIGLTDRLDINVARAKGGSPRRELRMEKLYEIALKYQILRQLENDPKHPIALSFFFNNVISAMDITKTPTYKFKNLGDRSSQVYQLIIAKKIGKVSLQLNPTLVHQGYLQTHDLQATMFAMGGAIRLPVFNNINLLVDYFHPFRTDASNQSFRDTLHFKPGIKFYNPLGVGVEIVTPGHVFHLNFTNSTEILENRFIPYTTKSWSKGEFRWGFTISRSFVIWRPKKKMQDQ